MEPFLPLSVVGGVIAARVVGAKVREATARRRKKGGREDEDQKEEGVERCSGGGGSVPS